ncbi:tetratricopeptide repeat protein [Leptospira harrisiae]|uniref:Anaphase-promoting protein n=1 Tax=Leptospira harrisiae TaxID=2023189 RepID=A0A2N0AHB6_9LEPT|nr:tetratricopeptide repeat protein [Leptospira harrisiae]PJZ83695.1 anaphase-promoting protein [Leptospira harrisiae]PKA06847.1 anaphase-promoting protein [Leptospira harrisiae]
MKAKIQILLFGCCFLFLSNSIFSQTEDKETIEINAKIELEKVSRNIINALRYGKFLLADTEWKKIQSDIYKSYPEYDYLNGSLLYSRMEWQEAKESLNKALKKEPNHEAASFLLGMIYAQEDSWPEAKDTWTETNQISPYNPFYHYNLGLAYFILKDYNNAILSLNKSLEYKANYNEAKLILAKTYLELNETEKAKAELLTILEQDPKHLQASHLMGRVVYLLEKDPKKSLTYLKNQRVLGWREKKIYARCYFEIRKWRDAENLLRPIAYSPFADEYDQSFYLNLLLNLGYDERANDFFHFIQKQSQNESKIAEAYRMLLSSREGKDLLYHYFKLRY